VKKEVIVADDEGEIRELVGLICDGSGMSSILCNDGSQAFDLIKAGHVPDLLITDGDMTRLGGIELMEKLRELGFLFPVILMTGREIPVGSKLAEKVAKLSPFFIRKPFSVAAIQELIARALAEEAVTP